MFHRDLSPEALVVNRQGLVKVLDLGLAKTPDADEAEEAAAFRPAHGRGAVVESDHAAKSPDRIARLHGSRTRRQSRRGRAAYRYLLARLHTLLPAHRPPTVRRKNRRRDPRPASRTNRSFLPMNGSSPSRKHSPPIVLKMAPESPRIAMPTWATSSATSRRTSASRASARSRQSEEQAKLLEQNAIAWHDSPSARFAHGSQRQSSRLASGSRSSASCPAGGSWLRHSSASASSPRWPISPSRDSDERHPSFKRSLRSSWEARLRSG